MHNLLSIFTGKVCTAEGQQFVNEEEGLDGAALATGTSENIHASHGFLRGLRNTQVSPEGMILSLVLFPCVVFLLLMFVLLQGYLIIWNWD